jgi:hypothetical protein
MRKQIILASILFSLIAYSSLRIPPGEDVKEACRKADILLKEKDADGLIALVTNSNFVVSQHAAKHLAVLGENKALPYLISKDLAYERGSTVSLGTFSIAIALLENGTDDLRRKALLNLAKTGFSSEEDLNRWHTNGVAEARRIYNTENEKRENIIAQLDNIASNAKKSLIEGMVFDLRYRDRPRSNAAAEALLNYANDTVVKELSIINDYGADYTILAYKCSKLNVDEAITLCINILSKHETPMRAESAQRVLTSIGVIALPAVQDLLKKNQALISSKPPPFTIHHTIATRCERIIKTINSNKSD